MGRELGVEDPGLDSIRAANHGVFSVCESEVPWG